MRSDPKASKEISLGGMGLEVEGAPENTWSLCYLGSNYIRAADRSSYIICGPLVKEAGKGRIESGLRV